MHNNHRRSTVFPDAKNPADSFLEPVDLRWLRSSIAVVPLWLVRTQVELVDTRRSPTECGWPHGTQSSERLLCGDSRPLRCMLEMSYAPIILYEGAIAFVAIVTHGPLGAGMICAQETSRATQSLSGRDWCIATLIINQPPRSRSKGRRDKQ